MGAEAACLGGHRLRGAPAGCLSEGPASYRTSEVWTGRPTHGWGDRSRPWVHDDAPACPAAVRRGGGSPAVTDLLAGATEVVVTIRPVTKIKA